MWPLWMRDRRETGDPLCVGFFECVNDSSFIPEVDITMHGVIHRFVANRASRAGGGMA